MGVSVVLQVFGQKTKVLDTLTCWPDDGARWKVRGSIKLSQFILRGTWSHISLRSIQQTDRLLFSVWPVDVVSAADRSLCWWSRWFRVHRAPLDWILLQLCLDVDWLDEEGGALEQPAPCWCHRRPDLPIGPDSHLVTHGSIMRTDRVKTADVTDIWKQLFWFQLVQQLLIRPVVQHCYRRRRYPGNEMKGREWADLWPWRQAFQLSRSTEAAMVFQLMLHFIFQEDKLKATPVTVEGLVDLRHRDRKTDNKRTDDFKD